MGVPLIDFSPLGDLAKVYDESKRRARREAILSSIPPDASTQSLGTLGMQLMRAGDSEGGIALARLADAALRDARDFGWRQQEAGRAQANADRAFALKELLLRGTPRGVFYRGAGDPAVPGAAGAMPSREAVQALRAAPELRDEFDAKYGPGAASQFIGEE